MLCSYFVVIDVIFKLLRVPAMVLFVVFVYMLPVLLILVLTFSCLFFLWSSSVCFFQRGYSCGSH